MSNSSLVTYKKISPNRTSPRSHRIDTITIHCMVGQLSVETCGNIFAPTSRQASSNYGVGADGRVGMYVEEKDRSWCSSNKVNDHRAVTIEVACDTKPPYAVRDKVYAALINLVADICKRNGIKKLTWSANKADRVNHRGACNMTVHRDFTATACPGEYLYSHMADIAAKVNAKLGSASTSAPASSSSSSGSKNPYAEPSALVRYGSKGSGVLWTQWHLKRLGYNLGSYGIDGSFGGKTLAAVKAFQRKSGLSVDGIVGPLTRAKLKTA